MFRNAWELGRISGIKIRLHWSFLLLPIYVYMSTIAEGQIQALLMVGLVLCVFGCVLLHELGHAFAARQFGIGTRDIILLPIGGIASLESMPRKPLQELWIAVAGPLVNVVIALLLFTLLSLVSLPAVLGNFLYNLAAVNVFLVLFNMIPAFPMDGGRVLRSVMAMFMPYVKATTIAATVGKYCALLMLVFGLININTHFMLILLAGFVYMAGQAEKMQVLASSRMGQFRQGYGQPNPYQQSPFQTEGPNPSTHQQYGQSEISVPSTLSGDSVAAWLSNMRAEYCSVVESGRVIGRLTKSQLLSALSQGFGNVPIGQILMQRQFQ